MTVRAAVALMALLVLCPVGTGPLKAAAARGPPPQPTLRPVLLMEEDAVPFPANASDVELGVRLVGTAPSTGVAASLAALLLLPGANASAAVAWGEGLVAELPGVVEPAALSWRAGESGVQRVRLCGVLEALAATLGEGWVSAPEARLVVALAGAAGADVLESLAGTEVLMDEDTLGGEADAAGDAPGNNAVFGFEPNQVAYPPDGSNSSGSSGSSHGIPVRLLSGMLTEPATLLWQLQLLTPATMQFLPSAAMQGVLRFEPPAPGIAPVTERWVPVPLDWSRVPPEAAYRLGLVLHGFHAARAAGQPDAVALHIFGTPNGTCPPGSALRNPPPAATSAVPATMAASTPAAGQQAATGDPAQGVADLMLSVNGSVIDLSSAFQPSVRDYGAQVEYDVANVTLCLRNRSAASIAVIALQGSSTGSSGGGSLLQPVDDAELDLDGLCSCEAAYLMYAPAANEADQTAGSSTSSCGYSAWQLPLAAGQNRFNITLQDAQANASVQAERYSLAVVRLSPPDHAGLASLTVKASNGTTRVLCGSSSSADILNNLGSAVPTQLMSIKRGALPLLPALQPTPCESGRELALNISHSTQMVSLTPTLLYPELPGIRVEVNGRVLSRGGNVVADRLADTAGQAQNSGDGSSASSNSSSDVAGGDSSLLPSAFIMGMQPGVPMQVAVVVVAEDGVTSSRYPITITRLPAEAAPAIVAASKSTGVSKGSNSSGGTVTRAGAAAKQELTGVAPAPAQQQLSLSELRARGWPVPPALQPGCSPCPAGWAAAGVNASQCLMCTPGTFSAAPLSTSCTPCQPGTYAYSWGSTRCKHCIVQTYAASAGSALCTMCPANWTTAGDGSAACDVPLDDAAAAAAGGRRAAVVVSFSVLLSGVDFEDVVLQAGVAASPEAVIASLVAADTASAFNVTLQAVQVLGVARVARRMLAANVTASLGVDLPPGASEAEVAAAVEVQRLSADAPIAMLSSDPDRFFGRTTKALDVTVAHVGAATVESRLESGSGGPSKWALIVPGMAGVVAGSLLLVAGCRRSRRCAAWRRQAADWLATTPFAPRASRYSRYAG